MKTIWIVTTLAVAASAWQPGFGQTAYEREFRELTENRDRALAAAAEPIHRRYKASLEQLLRRATQNNDLEAALKIRDALRALGGGNDGGAVEGPEPTGTWAWTAGRIITIRADGSFEVDKGGGGRWRWSRQAKGEFTMIWDRGGYRDSLVLSPDGRRISGSNNKGDKVSVTRLK